MVTELSVTSPPAMQLAEDSSVARRSGTLAIHAEAVQRAITAMHEHLEEPLSLESMAAAAILSRYHFSRVFHQFTGLPPGRFLAALRLAEAKRLLLTTRLTVTDICFRVGYNSLGTFTMRFTQSVGISPGRFRQLPHRGVPTGFEPLRSAGDGHASTGGSIVGRIEAPPNHNGPVFVGLFSSSIPEGRPRRCATLVTPGEYCMEGVSTGTYHVFAISLPWPKEPLGMFLPEHDSLHVGRLAGMVSVRGRGVHRVDVRLRPAAFTDPPVLIALPLLLAEQLGREAAGA
jgi:AraC-like DNA-binding protein